MFRGVGSYTKPPEREKIRRNPTKCYPPDKVSEIAQESVSLHQTTCLAFLMKNFFLVWSLCPMSSRGSLTRYATNNRSSPMSEYSFDALY